VTHVKYYDADGTLQTLASSLYVVTTGTPGRIVRGPTSTWPEFQSGRPDVLQVRFVAGYGLAADVPEPVKLAIKVLVHQYYENRNMIGSMPSGVTSILANECWGRYA